MMSPSAGIALRVTVKSSLVSVADVIVGAAIAESIPPRRLPSVTLPPTVAAPPDASIP